MIVVVRKKGEREKEEKEGGERDEFVNFIITFYYLFFVFGIYNWKVRMEFDSCDNSTVLWASFFRAKADVVG